MGIESTKYHEKVDCNFSETMYQKMAAERYGIEFCCQKDEKKWSIKKELSDFNEIKDLEYCGDSGFIVPLPCRYITLNFGNADNQIIYQPCGSSSPVTLSFVADGTILCADNTYVGVDGFYTLTNLVATENGPCTV